VAKIVRRGDLLVLRLNPIERVLDLRLRSPKAAVQHVESIQSVRPGAVVVQVDQGFAANTAPMGAMVTAKARGNLYQGGRAAVFVYLRFRSVEVMFSEPSPWRLWLVSSTRARDEVGRLRAAVDR
jgi:hypothetical protein